MMGARKYKNWFITGLISFTCIFAFYLNRAFSYDYRTVKKDWADANNYEAKKVSVNGLRASITATPPGKVTQGWTQHKGGWPWMGNMAVFNANMPLSYAGAHSSEFRGYYVTAVGGGGGGTQLKWEMDGTADNILTIGITGDDVIPLGVDKTYTANGLPTGGTYEWKITPISGAATIGTSTGIMKGTQAGEVFVEVT